MQQVAGADRWALREMLDELPMQQDPICDECLMAFWERLFGPPELSEAH